MDYFRHAASNNADVYQFLANHVCTSVKTVYTKLLAKNSKLHKLATTVVIKKKRLLQTCISFFSKIQSAMSCPISHIIYYI